MELTGPGPISMGSATTAFIVLLCSTIECKSRSCRGAALRKGIPTSISIHARVRSRNRNVLRKRNNKK